MFNEVEHVDEDRPAELRGLSKNQLYKLLNNEYLLPCKESRGVTSVWLVGVYRNQFFRVRRQDIQVFEATLSLEEAAKNSFFNLGAVMDRLRLLMPVLHLNPLGFADHVNPDEPWLNKW